MGLGERGWLAAGGQRVGLPHTAMEGASSRGSWAGPAAFRTERHLGDRLPHSPQWGWVERLCLASSLEVLVWGAAVAQLRLGSTQALSSRGLPWGLRAGAAPQPAGQPFLCNAQPCAGPAGGIAAQEISANSAQGIHFQDFPSYLATPS